MTRRTNARLAGTTFLLYIATAMTSMILFNQVTGGSEGIAAKLANMAQHASLVRLTAVLDFLQFVYPVVLGVTLYALTRDQDAHLAMIALCCRVTEGVIAAIATGDKLLLLSVATASTTATGVDAAATQALGGMLLKDTAPVGATCFAVGSTIFCTLFLRARSIPLPLAWLGVLASVLIMVLLPAQLAGLVRSPVTDFMWIPMALFEVVFAVWLIVKGVAAPLSPERA